MLLQLKERTKGSRLPEVFVTDMRKELEDGNRSAFGSPLQQAIRENLEKGQQTMLFLNRRGYSTFVSCRKCGEALTCPSCNVSYTYHASDKALVCHYCGKEVPVPKTCPSCGSHYIRYFGTGTQKSRKKPDGSFQRQVFCVWMRTLRQEKWTRPHLGIVWKRKG